MLRDFRLLCDREVAALLGVKEGTIRKQRCDRRHDRPHWFTLDPVMIGTAPRYWEAEFEAWLSARCTPAK